MSSFVQYNIKYMDRCCQISAQPGMAFKHIVPQVCNKLQVDYDIRLGLRYGMPGKRAVWLDSKETPDSTKYDLVMDIVPMGISKNLRKKYQSNLGYINILVYRDNLNSTPISLWVNPNSGVSELRRQYVLVCREMGENVCSKNLIITSQAINIKRRCKDIENQRVVISLASE